MEGGDMRKARKLTALLFATAAFATASAPALAAINEGPGAGNPDTNGSGKCSPGQNKDTSTGGLKKCP
jgi:Spy/CpxP family protein refolding chaperone